MTYILELVLGTNGLLKGTNNKVNSFYAYKRRLAKNKIVTNLSRAQKLGFIKK